MCRQSGLGRRLEGDRHTGVNRCRGCTSRQHTAMMRRRTRTVQYVCVCVCVCVMIGHSFLGLTVSPLQTLSSCLPARPAPGSTVRGRVERGKRFVRRRRC